MQRHTSFDDFKQVLSLTSSTSNNVHLIKARIHICEGDYAFLALYVKTKGKYKEAEELEGDLTELERVRGRTDKERNAGCGECDSDIKRGKESNGVEVRRWRAECVLDAGDVEGAVGDLTRLSHFLPPSTHLLTDSFHLAYFYLPPSPTPMATLKQSLHFDPDSKLCLSLTVSSKLSKKIVHRSR
ncbi:hypothetical protein BJ165DRAFT_331557 [Panaeolus papilionaceus]|nr:hypothetical protein BJ165DRAFT_331190 [Panaeolus papilionaceus]KAF9040918.1 hypothetical protein BJ165DRAFT_331457 [Panaeolus papilionaceus]KAF9040925.1 hypothetical protein BJ165DRAFT_331557 [Panaeolus papilionaceus]